MTLRNIPQDWKLQSLAQLISTFEAGVSVNGGDRAAATNEFGVLKISAVTEGTFLPEENKLIEGTELARARLNPKKNRIVMSRANTPSLVGASAYIDRDYPNLFLSDKLWQLEPRQGIQFSMRWLGFVISSPPFRRRLSEVATGSSQSMKNISKESVMQLMFPFPPTPEQDRISCVLDSWDTAIQKTEQLIAAKERRLHSLYQKLFGLASHARRGWKTFQLGELLSPRKEYASPSDVLPLYSLTIEDGITPKTDRYDREFLVKDTTAKQYAVVKPGDIVFNPSNLRWGAIARSKISHSVVVSPIYEVLSINEDRVNGALLAHELTSPRRIAYFSTKTEGTLIERMAVKLDTFLRTEICLPSDTTEQATIAALLDEADREISLLRQRVAALKTQKRGLMQKLLTGQWRLPVQEEAN